VGGCRQCFGPAVLNAIVEQVKAFYPGELWAVGQSANDSFRMCQVELSKKRDTLKEGAGLIIGEHPGINAQRLDKAPTKLRLGHWQIVKRGQPDVGVFTPKLAGAFFQQGPAILVLFRKAGHLDLHANELGSRRIALLLQPVGIDEPVGVIVGLDKDRLQKGVVHWLALIHRSSVWRANALRCFGILGSF
jgi:hypothetical protein